MQDKKEEISLLIQRVVVEKRSSLGLSMMNMALRIKISNRTLFMLEHGKHPPLKTDKQKLGWARSLTRVARACEVDPREWCEPFGLRPTDFEKDKKTFRLTPLLGQSVTAEDLEYITMVAKGLPNPMTIEMVLNLLELRLQKPPS